MAEQREYLDKEGFDALVDNIKGGYQPKGEYLTAESQEITDIESKLYGIYKVAEESETILGFRFPNFTYYANYGRILTFRDGEGIQIRYDKEACNIAIDPDVVATRAITDAIEQAQASDLAQITELQGKLNGVGNVQDFVNSSIATSTAEFKGTYDSLSNLQAQRADANDYGFVVSKDSEGNTVYNRYKYVEGEGWLFEYALNNSSFTAAQWASIQSGITSGHVAKIDLLKGLYVSDVSNSGGSVNITQKSYYDGVETSKSIDFKTINGQSLFGQGDLKISGGADAYTKTESDNKFATKTDVANTYATKTELDAVDVLAESVNKGLGETNKDLKTLETSLTNVVRSEKVLDGSVYPALDIKTTAEVAHDIAEDMRAEDKETISKELFVKLWNTYCTFNGVKYGEYDADRDVFVLNGVDHTFEEAVYNYNRGAMISGGGDLSGRYRRDGNIKTVLLPFGVMLAASAQEMFSYCGNLEVVVFDTNYSTPTSMVGAFNMCPKLREIKGLIGRTYLNNANVVNAFYGCSELQEVKIYFNVNLSFAQSPKLSLNSLKQGIQLKDTTDASTITVHPDVYAKLTTGDAEWQQLMVDAAEKNISFATV